MEDLQGKVAVITGGASGIGRAVAEKAAAEGMKIVIADIEEGPLKEAEGELTGQGAEAIGVVTDVSDAASVRELRDRALERFGAVHLVHNNAGIGTGGPIWDFSEEDWRWIIGVNQWGVIHGIATFVPLLMEQGEGHVVNTASIAGLTTTAFLGPYHTTKFAAVAMSEVLSKDLQMAGSPVGVSVLCPGFVQTRIAESDRNRPAWAPEQRRRGRGGAPRRDPGHGRRRDHPDGGGRTGDRRGEDEHLLHPHPPGAHRGHSDPLRRHCAGPAADGDQHRLSDVRGPALG